MKIFPRTILKRAIILFLLLNFIPGFSYSQDFRQIHIIKSTANQPKNIDVSIFRFINNGYNGISNAVIPITDNLMLPVSLGLPFLLAGISNLSDNRYDENTAVLMALSEITSFALVSGIKESFKRKRPFNALDSVYCDTKNLPSSYSFPSGHTASTFSIATSLTLRYPDKPFVIAVSFLYAGIVGYGRMYLGVHYPGDVLGGMLVGAVSAAWIYSLRKEIIKGKNNLFREKNKPDSNNKELSAPVILGLTIGVDLINQILQSGPVGKKVIVNSGNQSVNVFYNF